MNILVEIDEILVNEGVLNATYELTKFNQSAVCLRTIPSEYINEEFLSGKTRYSDRVELITKDKDMKKAQEENVRISNMLTNIKNVNTTNTEGLFISRDTNTPVEMVSENGDILYITEFEVTYFERS